MPIIFGRPVSMVCLQNTCTKGGIDGPAGPANAGALPRALRNAGPLFASVMSSTPPTLLSRCGNPYAEHAHYYIW